MGTSDDPLNQRSSVGDHPHAYGDKKKERKKMLTVGGSSPRVWGQVFVAAERLPVFGIIPTRMGTSFCTNPFDVLD